MFLRASVLLVTALILAGCYKSDTSLIADRDLATPYPSITYRETGSNDEPMSLTRVGKLYRADDDPNTTMRFLEVEPNWYLVELGGVDNENKPEFLYGYLNVDPDGRAARLYSSVADGATPPAAGMHECGDSVCVDNIDAYVAAARAAVAAGAEPDTTYQFKTTP